MNCSRRSELERLAGALAGGAALELYLTPKPGLVDLADCGAHPDLSIPIMERSIGIIAAYLDAIARSLVAGEAFPRQQAIGMAAEQQMFNELGTNTHKGYIFLAGMLLIARWHATSGDEAAVRGALSALAGDFFKAGEAGDSHGRRVREKYRAGGIVQESLAGFPSLFEAALPTFRRSLNDNGCFNQASFAMLARLMQTVDDTTTLHRGGPAGLARVKQDGRRLERMIVGGGDYIGYLRALNRSYVRINLTIGGIADMLGLAYGWLIARGEISEASLLPKALIAR